MTEGKVVIAEVSEEAVAIRSLEVAIEVVGAQLVEFLVSKNTGETS